MKGIEKYNNLYEGRTIFIIGNGTALNEIDKNIFTDQHILIGVNAAHVFRSDMNFYIAGHVVFPLLWTAYAKPKDAMIFHGDPASLKLTNTLVSKNNLIVSFSNIEWFKKPMKEGDPLVGVDMCIFSATHLAFLLGASTIVYVGCDSKVRHHFYDFDPFYWPLEAQCAEREIRYKENPTFMKAFTDFRKAHFPPDPSNLNIMISYYERTKNRYVLLFEKLKAAGVRVISTQQNSITTEAGAELLPLTYFL